MLHEAKLHTNREIMVREQEMLLEDLAAFMLALNAAGSQATGAGSIGSRPDSPDWLATLPAWQTQQQQQPQAGVGMVGMQQPGEQQQLLQQEEVTQQLLQQQQGGAGGVLCSGSSNPHSGQVMGLAQVIRGWTVQTMLDQAFPVRQHWRWWAGLVVWRPSCWCMRATVAVLQGKYLAYKHALVMADREAS
jgi:hypothetical protein